MAYTVASSPRDYHNSLADDPVMMSSGTGGTGVTAGTTTYSSAAPSDLGGVELAAFERGRMQGEMEAIRRLEAEGGGVHKTFAQDTLTVGAVAGPNIVEIHQLTRAQWVAAIVGELFSVAYIVIMAVWLDQYRLGGLDWSDSNYNGNKGMFNIHVWTGFAALWLISQAYLTYRMLPLTTNPMLNKAYYIFLHVLALTCVAISIACATMSQPVEVAWSMHAWTAYLATLIYASHAIYSCFKVLFNRHGVTERNWNESRPVTATEEQTRGGEAVRDTLYRASPSVWSKWRQRRAASQMATGTAASPVWTETTSLRENEFFLVPRKKWAIVGLVSMLTSVLIGLGEWQVLLARGNQNWPQGDPDATAGANQGGSVGGDGAPSVEEQQIGLFSTESVLIGVIGLCTLASVAAISYAAMPPRTTITKPAGVAQRRTSMSMGSTAPQSGVEVV